MPSSLCLLLASALAATVLATPIAPRSTSPTPPAYTTACATGVHIIAARGSLESPGEGKLQAVSAAIEAAIPGSDNIAVVYPAALIDYDPSEEAGDVNMTAEVQVYSMSCPDSKMVLVGYSQGAQIVGDVLGGGSYTSSAPLAAQYTKNIIAAIQFGDPAHIGGKPYDVGNGTSNGRFARKDTTVLDTYGSIIQSYCIDGDIVCDDGFSISTHTSEVATWSSAAVDFVISKAQAAGMPTG